MFKAVMWICIGILLVVVVAGIYILYICILDSRANKLNSLALRYKRTGRYDEAEFFFLHSLAIMEKSSGLESKEFAGILNNLACLYETTGRYAEAEHHYHKSLAIREQTLSNDHLDIAGSLNNLALLFEITGRYTEAAEYHQRSLAIKERIVGLDHMDSAYSFNNLAIVHSNTGRYVEAESCFQQTLAIIEQKCGLNHLDYACSLNNLAELYEKTERNAETETYSQMSVYLYSLNNLAELYEKTERYAEAETYLQMILLVTEKIFGPSHPDTAQILNNIAIVYKSTGRSPEAENFFLRSLAIRIQTLGLDHPDTARSLSNLSILYDMTNRLDASILLNKQSVNIFQKIRQDVSNIEKEVLSCFDKKIELYYDNLSNTLIKAGRYGEAEYVTGLFKEKEQFELLRRDRQIDFPTRTISYNDAEAPLVARFDEIASNLFALGKQEQALKQNKEPIPEQNPDLATIKDQLKKVNQEFSDFLNNLHEELPPREVTQIDQDTYKLINMTDADANTVAIFTVTAEDSFHAVMVTRHGRKAFSAEHKATDIATKVLKFREFLKDPEDPAYLALSQELYDIIIRPMEEEILSGEYTTILWMLNGVLRLLPLAALHDGKQFVLEKYRNVCITTCSTIGHQTHEKWNGLGMGVTHEHEGHSPLPSVKDELEGIISNNNTTGIIPGDILLDEAFTRNSMESHLEDGYKAVHFASHFELNPANETMSYLLLGDGSKIRMDELRSLPKLFKGVDLVAFSACSTGLGTASTRGREVDGIGYLGEMQGAKTVMATLWPVEDKSTSMLMREFYRLREAGMTKAEALRQAQLCLLNGTLTSEEGHDFTHPYFWAPFILIGNGG